MNINTLTHTLFDRCWNLHRTMLEKEKLMMWCLVFFSCVHCECETIEITWTLYRYRACDVTAGGSHHAYNHQRGRIDECAAASFKCIKRHNLSAWVPTKTREACVWRSRVNLHHLTLNIPQRDCCAGARCSGDAKMKYRAAPFLNVGSKAKRVFEIRMKAEFVDGRCLLW